MERRFFLKATALGGSVVGSLPALGLLSQTGVFAQSVSDYKALVCVYLFGGNDGLNTLVPYESAAHSHYLSLRPAFSASNQTGVGLSRQSLLPLSSSASPSILALHPALVNTHSRWSQGQVAWIQNVGNLIQPLSRSNYVNAQKPVALGSHSEQQDISMLAVQDPQGVGSESGWASRMLTEAQRRGLLVNRAFSEVSFMGVNRWQNLPLVLTPSAQLTLDWPTEIAPLISAGLRSSRPFTKAYAQFQSDAYFQGARINSVFSSNGTTAQTAFATGSSTHSYSHLHHQLLSVARFIEARSQLQAPGRQMFFVGIGGFDTHAAQYTAHANLLSVLDSAMHGFFSAMEALGVSQQVTAFTMSDFGRTLRANASHGTDHAWASHHMVMGGAVRGGLYGRAADITPTSEDLAPFDNNFVIPTTSINQYAATLAAWMGLNSTDLNVVFPDLRNFSQANLGFMNS